MSKIIKKTLPAREIEVEITNDLLDDTRKGMGAYPYTGMNPCANDPWYAASLAKKYSKDQLDAAREIVREEMDKQHSAMRSTITRV